MNTTNMPVAAPPAIQQALDQPQGWGRQPRLPRSTHARLQREYEEMLVSIAKIHRAETAAQWALLSEHRTSGLAFALGRGDVTTQLSAADYVHALHVVGMAQVMKAAQ